MNFWLVLLVFLASVGAGYVVIQQAVLVAMQKHTLWERANRVTADDA